MVRLLMKAKEILDEAKSQGILLNFDVDIDNSAPVSYKDIIFNRNELSYIQQELKDLEKKYIDEKNKKALENLDIYKEHIKDYNGILGIVMKVYDKDVNVLKTICDSLIQNLNNGFIFLSNIKDNDSINFIARSNCSINAGLVVKKASIMANGNGGGSPTFAQGGGRDLSSLDAILKDVESSLSNHE